MTGAPPTRHPGALHVAPAIGEFRCAECGYGVAVRRLLPQCPMCRGLAWEDPATSPYGRSAV